ncbi:uncharacterized protein LOC123527180 isoform X1 [Mercenaria mercenaria]|uniref:uncharacterized protein LOC123527180 isoform X1 n=1 Tax=Mercenaria mercenaria TaxID=6596 RepID=UPI00234EBD09|nr:uncharacterized protein LOC123527180 isoform X1 [Mercenaria mercenaria]
MDRMLGKYSKDRRAIKSGIKEVRQELYNFKRDISVRNRTQEEHEKQLTFLSKRKDLQSDLIEMYLKYKTKASVLPTMPEEETDVTNIYEKPDMVVADSTQSHSMKIISAINKGFQNMKSYKEMFPQYDRRNIYISGDAGMGKSTFCKHLIQQWCEVHMKNKEPSVHIFENREVLKAFEYLFYVSLCHMTHEYHVHQMVKTHLLTSSWNKELFDTIVETESERCLIILDGLDEWNPKGVDVDKCLRRSKIPQRDLLKKYTILTTTRPWKMEEARLKTTEIDIHAKVHGLTDRSSNQFIGNVVHYLNVKFGRFKNDSDFLKLLTFQGLSDMKSVPVVLLQLICLWHDDKPLGNSLCDTYSNMIDLFFEVAKFELNVQETCSQQLPQCFHNNRNCQRNKDLIFKLAKFSYKTLFSESPESTLVFDRSVAHDCGMTSEDIDMGLKIGLLTESKISGISASERLTSLSFLHQTFQEFLAAVLISTSCALFSDRAQKGVINTHYDDSYSGIEKQVFKTCNSVTDILEMKNIFLFVSGMNPPVAKQLSRRIQMIVDEDADVKRYREDFRRGELKQSPHKNVFSELKQICNLITCCIEEILNARGYMPVETGSCMYLSDLMCDNEDSLQPRGREPQLSSLLCIDKEHVKSIYIKGNCDVLETLVDFVSTCASLNKLEIQDLVYDRDLAKMKFASWLLKLGHDVMKLSKNSLVYSAWELGMNGNSLQMLFEEEESKSSTMKVVLEIFHIPHHHSDLENVLEALPLLTEIKLVDTYCIDHKLGTCPLHIQMSDHLTLQTLVLEHLLLKGIDIPTSLLDLQYISLNNFEFSHDDLEKIVSRLENAEQLKEIHLQRIACADHGVGKCTFLLHLTRHEGLQHVDLQYVPFQVIVNQPSLKYCCSRESNVEAEFLEGLANCHSLQMLTLSQSRMAPLSPHTAKAMTEVILDFSQLQELKLLSINFGNESPRLSNGMKKLTYVMLRKCTLTEESFQQFLASAPKVKHKLKISVLCTHIEEKEPLQDRERIYKVYSKQAGLVCKSGAVFDSYISFRFEN